VTFFERRGDRQEELRHLVDQAGLR